MIMRITKVTADNDDNTMIMRTMRIYENGEQYEIIEDIKSPFSLFTTNQHSRSERN